MYIYWKCYFYVEKVNKKKEFAEHYTFIDRQKGTNSLILIVAGFQKEYWQTLLANVKKSNKDIRDVCICVPLGIQSDINILYEIAELYNWSILVLNQDLLAQAQNTAIKLHPNATIIHKLDEDIVIGEKYFGDMEEALNNVAESEYDPGFLSPTININLATTDEYLMLVEQYEDFYNSFEKNTVLHSIIINRKK